MSELLDNAKKRRELLKHMILQLHNGSAPEAVQKQLTRLLSQIPYGDVVVVEQELISEGLPQSEVLKLCDVHTSALKGIISQEGAKTAPPGHPVHTFQQENRALEWEIGKITEGFARLQNLAEEADASSVFMDIRAHFNSLNDVNKHYKRKEYLLFPFLEKHDITGPPTVMWGKHDETRAFLKSAIEAFEGVESITAGEAESVMEFLWKPAITAIEEMIYKEEQILFPICLDTLNDGEWWAIYRQSSDYGFCLYDPKDEWRPEIVETIVEAPVEPAKIKLPSGDFTLDELTVLLNTIPFDITFVDRDDSVRYFSQGRERIFERNRAIIGRKVQMCHPPSSVHIVQKILDDFKSGKQDKASFWITLKGRFIMIEYYALRDALGEYLGVVEVSQDLTEKRNLQGERRLVKNEQ